MTLRCQDLEVLTMIRSTFIYQACLIFKID